MQGLNFVVERDPDTEPFIGYILGWPGAHSRGASLDELRHTAGIGLFLANTQRVDRIDSRRAPRRHKARRERDGYQ